ncbi:MAG: FkbM family methyltransferase [Candidatus Woesebacteria bacterium]|nr:MAG: FkbM family methyltransferase [Candidatus Woesebacteria bacterium]
MQYYIKQSNVYKKAKWAFYKIINVTLATFKIKNREYYYSKWIIDHGDETLYTKYPLSSKSLVLDIGGYEGKFSDQIITLYNPKIVIYEPVKKFFLNLKRRYRTKNSVSVLNWGLSNKNTLTKVRLSGDGTSIYSKSGEMEKVRFLDAAIALKKYSAIDLISINIEGSEYDVVERIIDSGVIKRIKNIQIQFHRVVPNCEARRLSIIKGLHKTHRTLFSYPFVWESFTRKQQV